MLSGIILSIYCKQQNKKSLIHVGIKIHTINTYLHNVNIVYIYLFYIKYT